MVKLVIDTPATFRATESFEVYKESKLFYSDLFTDTLKKYGILIFNLPKGNYFVNGDIERIEYQNPKLPTLPFKRYNENIDSYKIVRANINSRALIDHDNKILTIDNAVYNLHPYTFDLILYHEKGHCYYDSEYKADLYAVVQMLKNGYNPSQIIYASLEGFKKNESKQRINKILKTFEKI